MNLFRLSLLAATAAGLSGCLTSPYWFQQFPTKGTAVPIQAFTGNKDVAVKFECSKASHAGLYPWGGPEVWTLIANVNPSQQPVLDPKGGKIYGASISTVLPAACWHADEAYNPPKHMTAIRASQTSAGGSVTKFAFTYDKNGLECLGEAAGAQTSVLSTGVTSCAMKYSNSTDLIPYVRITALN